MGNNFENYVGDPKDYLREDPAFVELEIEGKVQTFVIEADFSVSINKDEPQKCYSRFELVRNPQAYIKVFMHVLSIVGQETLITKEEYDRKTAEREKYNRPKNFTIPV